MNTNAQTERVTGEYGTVEFHAKPASQKPYRKSVKPSNRLAGTNVTAQASAPSNAKRAKREQIESQQSVSDLQRKSRASAQWAEYVGYMNSQDLYGVKVKVRGLKAEIYWLPYSKAAMLWQEIVGEDFSTVTNIL